jgi:hypothetical protein
MSSKLMPFSLAAAASASRKTSSSFLMSQIFSLQRQELTLSLVHSRTAGQ